MKKYILNVLLFTSSFMAQSQNDEDLRQRLHYAIEDFSDATFQNVMRQVFQRFQNRPHDFLAFMNKKRRWGWTALMMMAELEQISRIKFLFAHIKRHFPNDPRIPYQILNIRDDFGMTPLRIAIERDNHETVQALLQIGLETAKRVKSEYLTFLTLTDDLMHWTPLMITVFNSNSNLIQDLVKNAQHIFGAHSPEYNKFINSEDILGQSALALAVEPWDKYFLLHNGAQQVDYDTLAKQDYNEEGNKALRLVESHRPKARPIAHLMEKYRDKYPQNYARYFLFLTKRDDAGWTVLMNASADGHADLVEEVLNYASEYFKNDPVWIIYLLTACDIHGRTALHLAISRRHIEVVKILLDYEKKLFGDNPHLFYFFINQKTELNGYTPLIQATYISGAYDDLAFNMIKMLIRRAVEVYQDHRTVAFDKFINAVDFDHQTALSYVTSDDIKKYMKRHGAYTPIERGKKPIIQAVVHDRFIQ